MKRPVFLLVGVVLLAGAVVLWQRFFDRPGGAGGERVELLDPARVEVIRTPGGLLEVSTLLRVEEFGWRTAWECPLVDCSSLPSTVSRIRVKANYVYRIPLAPEWRLQPAGDHYRLQVPAVQLQVPVGIDTSSMEIVTTDTSVFSPATGPNRENAIRHLAPELAQRGASDSYIDAQRQAAQRTVGEFARKWMLQQGRKLDRPVEVTFTGPAPL
jgi:hypothetical protein